MKDIGDILNFRSDISPFLVHLTKNQLFGQTARDVLTNIIQGRRLVCGPTLVSDARFGVHWTTIPAETRRILFRAICLTETPLNEIHCLLDIRYRRTHLQPYGLVFLKSRLAGRGVSPVFYINNRTGDQELVFQSLCSLNATNPLSAERLLPLISVFGQRVRAPGAGHVPEGEVDFTWEREWRYPAFRGDFVFGEEDVFVGLCPHDQIQDFQALFPQVPFVDPTRNMKWYATELLAQRQRHDLSFSVV